MLFETYTTPEACPAACSPYRTVNEFRGFEFGSSDLDASDEAQSSCKCLFDSNADMTAIAAITNVHGGTPTVTGNANQAIGSINDVSPKANVDCYALCTIEAPQDVTEFEYVGFGDCLDDSDAKYDHVDKSSVSTAFDGCGAACLPLNPRGFWIDEGTSCFCMFDDGATVAGETVVETSPGGGTGRIASSDYSSGHCYMVIPPPTNAPTASPTTAEPTVCSSPFFYFTYC